MAPEQSRTESPASQAGIDWDAAWRRHAPWLRTVVTSRVGESAAVDDVVQQVGLAVAGGHGRPTRSEHVAPWLYRVAVRQCLMHRRSAGRRRRLLKGAESNSITGRQDGPGEPVDWLLRNERVAMAQAALSELPEIERQLLMLKHTENWTYRQLAEHLGVGVHTVEYRLQQARDRLRRLVEHRGLREETK
jgi:RNA polymerase sigma-70 factor (ECF subfamily)